MTFVINLADHQHQPVNAEPIDQIDFVESYLDQANSRAEAQMERDDVMQAQSLPRLEDVTTEYLDDLARRLQWDTFSETAKMTYNDAWQHHFAQLEIASICFHSESGEATLPQKIIDNRLRFCEYQMQLLQDYGASLNDDIRASERTDTVTEIGSMSHESLIKKRDLLREQYAYVKNMHYVYLTKVRPEIERRTGYTMSAYKSVKQLDAEKKAKQYRMYRKKLTVDQWSSMTSKEKDEYLAKNAVVMSK